MEQSNVVAGKTNVIIDRVNVHKDRKLIERCMMDWYYPDDPILLATGRTDPGDVQVQHTLDLLTDGKSLKAINTDDGQIVGFAIMGEVDATSTVQNFRNSVETTTCEYYKKVLQFYLMWELETHFPDVLQSWKCWLTIHVIAVNPAYRRRGIMTSLIDACVQSARRNGYPGITIDISSYYTAKCVQKLDAWDCIFTLPLVSFNDRIDKENGQPFFKQPKHPHLHVSTYCLKF